MHTCVDCRDGHDAGGGGSALPVAEPPVRGGVHERAQLPARLQHGGLPVGGLQVARHGAQVLLQEDLLIPGTVPNLPLRSLVRSSSVSAARRRLSLLVTRALALVSLSSTYVRTALLVC